MESIANRIIEVCNAKANGNMSAFARAIGVSPAYISKLKNCPDRVPSDRTISDICREFGVSEVWLRTGEGEMFPPRDAMDDLYYLSGRFLASSPTDFQKRFARMLASLTPEEWSLLEKKARELLARSDEED